MLQKNPHIYNGYVLKMNIVESDIYGEAKNNKELYINLILVKQNIT